ncbi:MAG: DUF1318 domain-containing protein [Methylococcaceae bacterium]|nr:DUF1318 domain-containing protein [Methylococcaceae bacterium]
MRNHGLLFFVGVLAVNLALTAEPALAVDLAEAKASGQVGERLDGYLGLVSANAPAEVKTLVSDINTQRRMEYQRIAAKNGVPEDQVARLTARKVIDQATPGQFVETPSGWQRR